MSIVFCLFLGLFVFEQIALPSNKPSEKSNEDGYID
jgi:hypothetical protein